MMDEDHKQELRIWLRLFASTTLIENEIRSRLRERFAFTLPRFDLLAQLDWADDGLSLGEVSRLIEESLDWRDLFLVEQHRRMADARHLDKLGFGASRAHFRGRRA